MSRAPVVALLVVGAVAAVLAVRGTADDGYRIEVELADAAGLRKNSMVKLAGARVGTVKALELTDDDVALATLEIDDASAPVGRDAQAKIRPANLLGEKYVDLERGDTDQPVPSGTRIPRERTDAPVELDDVLAVLDVPTRVRLGLLIDESGLALEGRGAELRETLVQLPPALDQAHELVAELSADERALERLVEESDRVLAELAPERRWLGRMVDNAEGALSAVAARRAELGQTVREASPTLAQIRRTLGELETSAQALGPASNALREAAPPLTAVLRALPAFREEARPTLAEARTAAPLLTELAEVTRPFARRLRPAAGQLRRFSRSLAPVTSMLDRGGMSDTLGVLEGWARAIQVRDGLGHLFRSEVVIDDDLVATVVDHYVGGVPKQNRRSRRGDRPGAGRAPARLPRGVRAPREPSLPRLLRRLTRLPELPRLLGVPKPPRERPLPPDAPERILDFLLAP
jgi:phospholipid/cholesterol/gamma-HCH transport system substrate-binding protein